MDGPAPCADIAERVPRWQQVRILLVEFVLETAEGAFALDGLCQPAPGTFIGGDGFGEVGHVLVPDPRWQRIDADQVQVVEVHEVWPSMPVSAVQNAISPVCGWISHRCS